MKVRPVLADHSAATAAIYRLVAKISAAQPSAATKVVMFQ
jgi:hypothetical protein